jgi:K+-transporting ATPase ATPase B chain
LAVAPDAFKKLDPRVQIRNPVMFVVEVGAAITTYTAITGPASDRVFNWTIVVWLWLTVVFANLAEAVAEGRGKAQAETLRRDQAGNRRPAADRLAAGPDRPPRGAGPRHPAPHRRPRGGRGRRDHPRRRRRGRGDRVGGRVGDHRRVRPVIRESGGDRSAVTGGTKVLSDRIVVQITSNPGETFIDRMIALVEGAQRQKTPNEIALNILLASLTIIFMLAVITLQPMAYYSKAPQSIGDPGRAAGRADPDHDRRAAVGHRHRRHRPAGAAQRAGHVRPRGRGGR